MADGDLDAFKEDADDVCSVRSDGTMGVGDLRSDLDASDACWDLDDGFPGDKFDVPGEYAGSSSASSCDQDSHLDLCDSCLRSGSRFGSRSGSLHFSDGDLGSRPDMSTEDEYPGNAFDAPDEYLNSRGSAWDPGLRSDSASEFDHGSSLDGDGSIPDEEINFGLDADS